MFTEQVNKIFERAIDDYYNYDNVDQPLVNPFTEGSIEYLLYCKSWDDTLRFQLAGMLRDPNIDASEALKARDRIKILDGELSGILSDIDNWFADKYSGVTVKPGTPSATEFPSRAISALSSLALEIHSAEQEIKRTDAGEAYITDCQTRLSALIDSRADISMAAERMLEELEAGRSKMN